MSQKQVLVRDTETGDVSGDASAPFRFPADAVLRTSEANGGEIGTIGSRWSFIRAAIGFRRSVAFGIVPMDGAGVSLAPLSYAGCPGLGYVMLRDGFVTGIAANISGAEAGNVTVQAFADGAPIADSVLTIFPGGVRYSREFTPFAVVAGTVIAVRYTDAAGATRNLAATLEIED
jgi:hypothetical protein